MKSNPYAPPAVEDPGVGFLLADVERIEYRGVGTVIITKNGKEHRPSIRCYGGRVEELVSAVKAAVSNLEPTTQISQRGHIESTSLMRRLGMAVGFISRWIRKLYPKS